MTCYSKWYYTQYPTASDDNRFCSVTNECYKRRVYRPTALEGDGTRRDATQNVIPLDGGGASFADIFSQSNGADFRVIPCTDPNYPSSRIIACAAKTGGSAIVTANPGMSTCTYSGSVCAYSSTPGYYSCTSKDTCPCTHCSSKYPSASNIQCGLIGGTCILTSQLADDDGRFCQPSYRSTCAANPLYSGTSCAMLPDGSCALESFPMQDTSKSVCSLSGGSCSSRLVGVECSLDTASNSCQARPTGERYCFTPQEREYIVEDLSTGKGMTIKGYDKRTQLDINLKNAFITPSSVVTSPGSDVCFRSADGKQHTLAMPIGVNEGADVGVPSVGLSCLRFPNGIDAWTIRLKERLTTSAAIISKTTDAEVSVKYQLFNPDSVIVRPGSQITFVNKDATSHTLLKGVTESALSTYILNDRSQSVTGTFSTGTVSSASDIGTCSSDANCTAGSFCTTDGLCRPLNPCVLSSDCPSGFACYSGNCTQTRSCTANSDCAAGYICSSGICAVDSLWCAAGQDCPPGYDCTSGRCKPASLACAAEVTCPSDSECTPWDCLSGLPSCNSDPDCAPGNTCFFGRCISASAPCSSDSDCGPMHTCAIAYGDTRGACTLSCPSGSVRQCMLLPSVSCQADANCSAGQSCSHGYCMVNAATCAAAVPCLNGYDCVSGGCVLHARPCTNDSECATGYSCVSGECSLGATRHCTSDSGCPSGSYCSTDGNCIELKTCSSLATCLQANTSSSCFVNRCKIGLSCGSSEDCAPGQLCLGGLCSVPFGSTCGGLSYGSDVRFANGTFTVPLSTQRVTLVYEFNDNGKASINGYGIAPLTRTRCVVSDMYTSATAVVPIAYLNLGGPNTVNITTCSCYGNIGAKLTLVYEYLPAFLLAGTDVPISLPPFGSKQVTLTNKEDFVYVDKKLLKSMTVSVKDCDGTDVSSIAERIGQYERSDYKTSACDTGDQADCADYNPYGPATVAILTTEEGLDLTNATERACALAQLGVIQSACPQCTSALYVGDMNISDTRSLLSGINDSDPALLNGTRMIARSALLNDYPTCSIDDVMNDLINSSKQTLYTYEKPTVLLDFGIKASNSTAGNCTWTNESIISAYTDLFGIWIPLLAGSGVVGISQHCYTDPCPQNDNYGLLTDVGADKAYTPSWFQEGCGRYYYNAEGLSLTTFSMADTNYSLCDPSRILAVLQSAECGIGKKTLKSKIN
ncbi:Uncharacterised protein [uncultured archaeon]|nr:Uncharacterised protein [uncultured archaeon]